MVDELVWFGGEVKAMGNGQVGGYLVLFGTEETPDLSPMRDFFTPDTDYDFEPGMKTTVYYQHGMDEVLKKRKLGRGELKMTDAGVWIEAQLNMRDEYERAVYEMAERGKLGWSSGAPGHLVERVTEGKAHRVTKWPLGSDASLTPVPADWRNVAVPLKSLVVKPQTEQEPEASKPETSQDVADAAKTTRIDVIDNASEHEVNTMSDEHNTPPAQVDLDGKFAAFEKQLTEKVSGILDPVVKHLENLPQHITGGVITPDGGTADRNVKNAMDWIMAIKRKDHKRLTNVYGMKAQVEDGGTTGGYYIQEQVLDAMMPGLKLTSGIGSMVNRIPVGAPDGRIPIPDYSRTPTANAGNSAGAMGIESQGRVEGGAYAAETIYFEQMRWQVWDYASGYLSASRELKNDAPIIVALIRQGIEEDVANKEEFAILRGNGVGKPKGVLNWAGAIGIDEDTDNTFDIADADEMVDRLKTFNQNKVAWVHHPFVGAQIAAMDRNTGSLVFDPSKGVVDALRGRPRFASQHLPAQGTDGYVILGDWSKYWLMEYGGLYIDFSEHADFLNGNDVWRFGKRQDGFVAMTSYITLADGSSTVSPFVYLANKT